MFNFVGASVPLLYLYIIMDPATALLIGSATGFGSNLLGFANQEHLNQQQMKFNREERLAAQEYNTSERLAVQEYNDPSNQMARLMAAGINPNTATGMVDGSTSSPMSVSASSMSPVMSQFANNVNDLAMLPQSVAQTKLIDEQAETQRINNKFLEKQLGLNIKQTESAIDLAKSDKAYKDAMTDFTKSQKKQCDSLLQIAIDEGTQRIEQAKAAVNQYNAQIKLIEEETKNAKKQGKQIDATTSQINAQTGLINANTEQVYRQTESINEDIKYQVWQRSCREQGFDPNSDLGSNIFRIATIEDPIRGGAMIDNALDTAKKAIDRLGERKPAKKNYWTEWSENLDNKVDGIFKNGLWNPLLLSPVSK